jgi:hypothetical protein
MRDIVIFLLLVVAVFIGIGEWRGWYLGVPGTTPVVLYKMDHRAVTDVRTVTRSDMPIRVEGRVRQGTLTVEVTYERPSSFQTGEAALPERVLYEETFTRGQRVLLNEVFDGRPWHLPRAHDLRRRERHLPLHVPAPVRAVAARPRAPGGERFTTRRRPQVGHDGGRAAARLHSRVLLLAAAFGPAHAQAQALVRVLLADAPAAIVRFDGPHRGSLDGRPFESRLGLDWPVIAHGDRLWVDGRDAGRQLDLTSDDGFAWDGRRYRGTLRLIADQGRVRVVNVLDIEAYLRGVVPAEMQASWPAEALKAQAVAARTYTLLHLDANRVYDVCATIDCQVYRGREVEHPASDAAIAATAGEVLTYGGVFARTYYHADSGGVIASSAEVWGSEIPYLQAFQDVSSGGPHASWSARLDRAALPPSWPPSA